MIIINCKTISTMIYRTVKTRKRWCSWTMMTTFHNTKCKTRTNSSSCKSEFVSYSVF